MKLFGRRGSETRTARPATARDAWAEATADLAALRDAPASADALVKGLTKAIGSAQRAATLMPTSGYILLAGAHLVAAAATAGGPIPTDAHVRSVGHAAAALKLADRSADQETLPLERVVDERFKVARARIRGSIYVPRDVEAAVSGQIEGVRAMAADEGKHAALEKLLRDGVRAGIAWPPDDVAFIGALVDAAGSVDAGD